MDHANEEGTEEAEGAEEAEEMKQAQEEVEAGLLSLSLQTIFRMPFCVVVQTFKSFFHEFFWFLYVLIINTPLHLSLSSYFAEL